MRPTGPHPLRARELTTPHPEGLTTRLVLVEVDLKQQIFDVCSSLNNGHAPKGRLRQLCALCGNDRDSFNNVAARRHACSRESSSGASVRFDDLVRPFLVANDLTDAIEIALARVDGNDKRGLKIFEFAGPSKDFAIVWRARQKVALFKNLIAFLVGVSAEPMD